MPSNKFAPLVVCHIFVLFLALAGGPFTARASGVGGAAQSLVFSHEPAGDDKKRKPKSAKQFLTKNGKVQFASVGGRVLTSRGKAISHAQVGLYNADMDQWMFAKTGTFGHYTFHDLPLSDFYVLVVIHKRYLFLDGSRTFTLESDMFNINFVASELD